MFSNLECGEDVPITILLVVAAVVVVVLSHRISIGTGEIVAFVRARSLPPSLLLRYGFD